ncbi:PREDICTED: uncharacterized protein LOC107162646 [Diuraphis noxia]|uniref:uncharacterized protein LOC107162646 n=1 Tax=Diuraphis noxia TaxID=143948 RepID=UPI0007639D80|nr:PREDICTED: uncharacterized protein LOC107162646 [Diuraphis noxia]XP_015365131.1 PREDICTED: uncharacterized protein LOC107162646 [Diuraphis noxia]
MNKSLVPQKFTNNDLYITHAEFQGCFIKVWANFYSQKRTNLEKNVQNYENYSRECNTLDLFGNKLYVYTWKNDYESRVYRCRIIYTDLVAKTHTIVLIDYGRTMVASYFDVREVIQDVDPSFLIDLCQRATVYTFLLSTYISKPKSNNELVNILCNKYYKYRRDFEVGGITFISLFGVDKVLVDKGIADNINLATMITIAKSLESTIEFNNKNDTINHFPINSKPFSFGSFLRSQRLDYVTLINISVTKVVIDNISILLTVRTLDNESEALTNMLNSIDRQNLKLAPVLEVYTPCLIVLHNKLVRAIILEVKIDKLYIDLVDYGIKELVPRTAVFEIPSNCFLIEMRSLNVIVDKPKDTIVDQNMFIHKYFQMLPLKIDPNFGLYKVKLFKKNNEEHIDVCKASNNTYDSISSKSQEIFSITEISDEIKSIENCTTPINHFNGIQIENEIVSKNSKIKESSDSEIKEIIDLEVVEKEPEVTRQVFPIMVLKKETLNEAQEIIGSLIHYKSPFDFSVRLYNPNFEPHMDHIKSVLDSRCVLKKYDLVKNMYVICQIQSDSIYRAKIIDMDSKIENIKLQLIDEGDKIINEYFDKIILYNFVESDCNVPGQLVMHCSLYDMWFPVINTDTTLMLQPHFKISKLYKVLIVKTNESGTKVVQLIHKDTNVDVSNAILQSGIGQRLNAAMKTDENPYEENLLIGQCFLSYVYNYHLKIRIQPEPNTVDELEDEIAKHINENPDSELMDINHLQNTYCLATVDNKHWYRAYIKNINEESIIVNMFDIGLLTDVSLNQIRPITSNLLRRPQLCLNCHLESKDLDIKITEKTLYKITVKSIDPKGMLCISIKEHYSVPLSTPIVRGIEKISFLHVDGDLTYMQRSQDISMVEKISENLSKLSGKLGSKTSIVPGDITMFESHGKYYRCVVKSINSKLAVVHCIDFGYEKQIEKKKLQCLGHTKIALLPALVITVKTFPMACNMSRTMFLANMHVDHNGTLNALPNKMTPVQSQNKLMETLENGCVVRVTCINSSSDCWIVPHLLNEKLEIISEVLMKMQSKMIPAITEIGSMCAALHSVTKKWHRALILDVDGSSENVLAIDSGEKFKALKTTKLVSEIQKIPNCALHCQVVSNVDINTLLNRDVECKLMSYTQSLLEVKLIANYINEPEVTSTVSSMEWYIAINRFESFNEFYVKKVDYECGSNNNNVETQLNYIANNLEDFPKPPPIGTLVAALTDKNNGLWYKAEVLNPIKTNLVVRIISDGTVCKAIQLKVLPCIFSDEKLYFRCCLDQEIVDVNINDPLNFDIISDMMTKYKWIMTTTSNTEPYKVTLTYDGVDCLDMLYTVLTIDHHDTSNNSKMSESRPILSNIELNGDHAKPTLENPLNNIPEKKIHEIDLVIPEVEIVVIKYVETFQYFYVHSESLSMLYMKRISEDLDLSIVELSLNDCMVGSIVVTLSTYFNCWCRAKIEIITDSISAKCYLLDFGEYEDCTEFYKPTEFLCMCPPLVRRCSLYAPKLAGQENEIWFPNINDMFKDITSIDGVKFNMVIKTQGDPCVVSLQLEDSDVGEMMYPLYVQLTHVKSFTDFKIKAISTDQKCMNQLLERYMDTADMLEVQNPIVGELYLTKINSKYVRVKLESFSDCKYLVVDIDDTLDMLSVANLYELPESISKIPMLCMTCSLILDGKKENYSLSNFQKLANPNVTFVMCIITENDGTSPNQVKLYIDNKDVLDLIRLQ